MELTEHHRLIEAILFASAEPLSEQSLAERVPEAGDLHALLVELQRSYMPRGVNLVETGGRWAFRTAPDLGTALRHHTTVARKLSRAAVETMAIIAYHQPVTRSEIEDIRGHPVSKGTVDTLLEAGWVKPVGRKRVPGRPVLWGTTQRFLDHFGLARIADLPGLEELKSMGLLDGQEGGPPTGDAPGSEEAGDGGAGPEDEAWGPWTGEEGQGAPPLDDDADQPDLFEAPHLEDGPPRAAGGRR